MRLICLGASVLHLEEFNDSDVPRYAILSHVWCEQEMAFSDMPLDLNNIPQKAGFHKVVEFCAQAQLQGYKYAWADTCCINKSNAVELGQAINSMYKWYSKAGICLAYLVDHNSRDDQIQGSEWFRRGWTLQELIAPANLEFYNSKWELLGTKTQLKSGIAHFTGIDERVLAGASPILYSVAQRMSWAAGRRTTRIEDRAYSLLGLFGIMLPMIYGDSDTWNAFITLQEAIIADSDDQSIFAWDRGMDLNRARSDRGHCGLLADSPDAFTGCSNVVQSQPSGLNMAGYRPSNVGLSLNLYTEPYFMGTYIGVLDCTDIAHPESRYGIFLEILEGGHSHARVRSATVSRVMVENDNRHREIRTISVRQRPRQARNWRYGFWIRSLSFPNHDDARPWTPQTQIIVRDKEYQLAPQGCIVEMEPYSVGTVCVIRLPIRTRRLCEREKTNPYQLHELRLGFDNEFTPICSATFCDTSFHASEQCSPLSPDHRVETTRRSAIPSFQGEPQIFSNSWLADAESSDQQGNTRVFILKKSTNTVLKVNEFGSVRYEVNLEEYPLHLGQSNEGGTDNRWTIWTIDMTEIETLYSLSHIEKVTFDKIEPCRKLFRHRVDSVCDECGTTCSSCFCSGNSRAAGCIWTLVSMIVISTVVVVVVARAQY